MFLLSILLGFLLIRKQVHLTPMHQAMVSCHIAYAPNSNPEKIIVWQEVMADIVQTKIAIPLQPIQIATRTNQISILTNFLTPTPIVPSN